MQIYFAKQARLGNRVLLKPLRHSVGSNELSRILTPWLVAEQISIFYNAIAVGRLRYGGCLLVCLVCDWLDNLKAFLRKALPR